MRVIGVLPGGEVVQASEAAIAQYGLERLRFEMVDREHFRRNLRPPGYWPVVTDLGANAMVVWVKADTAEQAVRWWLENRERR